MSEPSALIRRFEMRTPKSAGLVERLRRVMPGGETRSATYYPPYPVVIDHGEGAEVVDVDGNRYIDVLNNYTSLVHGHAFGPIVDAAKAAISHGTAFPAPSHAQLELAEALCRRYPAIESVRFTNSGTEASLLALRIARRVTGRSRFLVFEGGYHGTAPEFADVSEARIAVPYNDLPAVEATLGRDVAAVFVEPFLGSGGVIPAEPGFLEAIGRAAKRSGAVFVLDEVQSLRTAFAGAHAALDLRPDLVTMGKIIGGGFPVGAVGGRVEMMHVTAADRPGSIAHSGTFNGNPVTAAAGLASLSQLTPAAIESLNTRGEDVAAAISESAGSIGIPAIVTRAGSIMHLHLVTEDQGTRITNATEANNRSAPDQSLLHIALMNHGVYAAPRGMLNLSTVISDDQVDRLLAGYRAALLDIAETRSGSRHALSVG